MAYICTVLLPAQSVEQLDKLYYCRDCEERENIHALHNLCNLIGLMLQRDRIQ